MLQRERAAGVFLFPQSKISSVPISLHNSAPQSVFLLTRPLTSHRRPSVRENITCAAMSWVALARGTLLCHPDVWRVTRILTNLVTTSDAATTEKIPRFSRPTPTANDTAMKMNTRENYSCTAAAVIINTILKCMCVCVCLYRKHKIAFQILPLWSFHSVFE